MHHGVVGTPHFASNNNVAENQPECTARMAAIPQNNYYSVAGPLRAQSALLWAMVVWRKQMSLPDQTAWCSWLSCHDMRRDCRLQRGTYRTHHQQRKLVVVRCYRDFTISTAVFSLNVVRCNVYFFAVLLFIYRGRENERPPHLSNCVSSVLY